MFWDLLNSVGVIVGLTFAVTVILTILWMATMRKVHHFTGKHVMITGGSQGIGKELAICFLNDGATVTICARNETKLKEAQKELTEYCKKEGQTVSIVPMDVSDYSAVKAGVKKAEQANGPINAMVMSAGVALTGYFLELEVEDMDKMMKINYGGALHCVKAVLPSMIANGQGGNFVFLSSPVAFSSFLGYTAYAPTKAAVRALAEGLRNELKGFKIAVHIGYPPDTDTPGYEEENLGKPKENLEIQPPEVFPAAKVAELMFEGIQHGEYSLSGPDPVLNIHTHSNSGFQPWTRQIFLHMFIAPIGTLAMRAYGWNADRIAARYGKRVLDEAEQEGKESAKDK